MKRTNLNWQSIADGLESGLRDFLIVVAFVLSVLTFMTVAANSGRELTPAVRAFLEIAPLLVVSYMAVRAVNEWRASSS